MVKLDTLADLPVVIGLLLGIDQTSDRSSDALKDLIARCHPVPNVEVSVEPIGDPMPRTTTGQKRVTNEKGEARFQGLGGQVLDRPTFSVTAIVPGMGVIMPDRVRTIGPGETIMIHIRKSGVIKGKVEKADGKPLSYFFVKLHPVGHRQRPPTHGIGKKGEFAVYGVPEGTYTLVVEDAARQFKGGYFVRTLLLPGHGTTPEDFAEAETSEFIQAVLDEVRALKEDHNQVYLVGHSMGSALSVLAAAAEEVDGLVLGAPYFGVTYQWYYVLPAETWTHLTSSFVHRVYKSNSFIRVNRDEAKEQIFSYRWVPAQGTLTLIDIGKRASEPETLQSISCPVLILHVEHIRSYLSVLEDIENVCLVHGKELARFIFEQMKEYYWETPTEKLKYSRLEIFAGVYDGMTGNGTIPITHSINFYNKLLKDLKEEDSSKYVSDSEKLALDLLT